MDSNLLLKIKLSEVKNHLRYLDSLCNDYSANSYLNLSQRLQKLLIQFADLQAQYDELSKKVDKYVVSIVPALDTWRQIYNQLVILSAQITYYRTKEAPAYLTPSKEDEYFVRLLSSIHNEIGLTGAQPTVALHQPLWFAVAKTVPEYPLYFLPATLVEDISELPLIFHEIGHVLFRLWNTNLVQPIQAVLNATFQRKKREVSHLSDPKTRKVYSDALQFLQRQVYSEMEETTCDIIGVLLGGEAFSLSLAIGLWTAAAGNPSIHVTQMYPPIDCRIRLALSVLRDMGLTGDVFKSIRASWEKVRHLYPRDPWYDWFYDQHYFSDLTAITAKCLEKQGVNLYQKGSGGIRGNLSSGAVLRIKDINDYQTWHDTTIANFKTTYRSVI